jgi:hypothetical protein
MISNTYTIVNCDGGVDVVSYGPYYAFTVCALSVTSEFIESTSIVLDYPCECCLPITDTSITTTVLDTPNAISYSRGSAIVGLWNGTSIYTNTGSVAKSTGNVTTSISGDLDGQNNCIRGAIEVTAFVPSSISGSAGYRTQITVTKNGFPIGTVTSGPNPTGSNVTQTFDFNRNNNDVLNLEFSSFI